MIILSVIALIFLIIMISPLFYIIFGLSFGNDYVIFKNYLDKISKKEKIQIKYFKTTKELNITVFNNKKWYNRAEGVYIYSENINTKEISNSRIYLCNSLHFSINDNSIYNLLVYAHELGHYFRISKYNDKSEKSADLYAIKLLKEGLPNYRFYYPLIFFLSIG